MNTYVALLRAVNVGGTGKLAMSDLRAMCESIGFAQVRTYIASGNVVCESKLSEISAKTKLERCLEADAGKQEEDELHRVNRVSFLRLWRASARSIN